MGRTVQVDLVTFDPRNDEYVLYLVEDDPWPDADEDWRPRLESIQHRIFSAADVAIDGLLAREYADSRGKRVRVQIDSPHGAPDAITELVVKVNELLKNDEGYASSIRECEYISGIRVVTGAEMGRFRPSQA